MSKIIEANSRCAELFEQFLDKQDETRLSKQQIAVRNAIQSSFAKLDYIIKLMDDAQMRAIEHAKNPRLRQPYRGLDQDFVGQTEVHAESFYCEAHRLKKFLLDRNGFLDFKTLRALPLTFIRNHVVEHCNVDKNVSSWGGERGPRLFVGDAILPKNKITDKGFYPNAVDFYVELQSVFEKAV